MPSCSFCKKHYNLPRGLTVFTFDGRSVHFCSSKCKRNLDLKRDPKKVNWIKREKKGKKAEEKIEKIKAIKEETGSEKTEVKPAEKPKEKKTEAKKEEKNK
jgi:large subunit ribosomal protein L24e